MKQDHGVQRVTKLVAEGGALKPTIWDQFSLKGHVGVVAGGAGALGLESALAVIEAGAIVCS
jgi:hypothetical protein